VDISSPRIILRTDRLEKQVATGAGPLVILRGVSFSIFEGETVSIIGASGSGKSTLLGLLAGLDAPTGGHVWLDGVDIFSLDEDARAALRGQSVGFVFQSFQLLQAFSALENVMLPLELKGVNDAAREAEALLRRVGLGERLTHYPRTLSGGEQQRVAIARAFASKPRLLFADEPTGNLDATTGTQIVDLLFDLNREQGTTLVVVTHDQAIARRTQRILKLVAGSLSEGASVASA
jgi:putative ABC transport system ATP-binding protein